MRFKVGLGACNPLQLPLFSTWFAKHLNVVIKGEGIGLSDFRALLCPSSQVLMRVQQSLDIALC